MELQWEVKHTNDQPPNLHDIILNYSTYLVKYIYIL